MPEDTTTETLQRVRRIETRLTQLMIATGVHTGAQKPVFNGSTPASVSLPSPHTSLKDLLSAVPDGWTGPIRLCIGSETIGTFIAGSKLKGDRSW